MIRKAAAGTYGVPQKSLLHTIPRLCNLTGAVVLAHLYIKKHLLDTVSETHQSRAQVIILPSLPSKIQPTSQRFSMQEDVSISPSKKYPHPVFTAVQQL